MAEAVTGEGQVPVRAVLPEGLAALREEGADLRPGGVKERADDLLPHWEHTGQPPEMAPPDQVKEKGLGLIVLVVGHGDPTFRPGGFPERPIAEDPGSFL